LCNVVIIEFHKKWKREGINQYIDGIINRPKNVLIQFRDMLKMVVEGSKTENKLVIIFKLKG
jgi:hypothetical protein